MEYWNRSIRWVSNAVGGLRPSFLVKQAGNGRDTTNLDAQTMSLTTVSNDSPITTDSPLIPAPQDEMVGTQTTHGEDNALPNVGLFPSSRIIDHDKLAEQSQLREMAATLSRFQLEEIFHDVEPYRAKEVNLTTTQGRQTVEKNVTNTNHIRHRQPSLDTESYVQSQALNQVPAGFKPPCYSTPLQLGKCDRNRMSADNSGYPNQPMQSRSGYTNQPMQPSSGYPTQPMQSSTGYTTQPMLSRSGYPNQPMQSSSGYHTQSMPSGSYYQTPPMYLDSNYHTPPMYQNGSYQNPQIYPSSSYETNASP